MMRFIVPLVFVAATAAPAFAAEYHIVRGADRNCRVVETTQPAEKTVTIVGNKRYVTREEAERETKVVCRDDHDRR